jgi:hypothetical protein
MKPLALVLSCLVAGYLIVTAWSLLGQPGAAAATQAPPIPSDAVSEARRAAERAGKVACDALLAYKRVVECHFVDYVPSVDIRIADGKLAIDEICDRAADIVASAAPEIASPWLKLRVFLSGNAPPSAACRRI